MNEDQQNTTQADIHYSWVSYPQNAPEEDQDERVLKLGGDSQFLNAELVTFDDGSMALNLLSTGLTTKLDLVSFLESVHTIARHDYLETEKQKREREE